MQNRQTEFSGAEPVREGFELDIPSLQAYMEQHVEGFKGDIRIQQFKGGQSNPTYLIITEEKKYVLRRKPPGKLLKSAHAVDREYRVIKALQDTPVPVAKTYALCRDESVIGTWFYIMEHVEGRIFWTTENIPKKDRFEICMAMNETMANLHQVDYKSLGLSDYGKTGNYFERQISRWSKQYEDSKDQAYPAMESLIEWLKNHVPQNDETTLVHGDFRLDNLIIHPTENRILAVLDWELSTLGHPLSDFSHLCLAWRAPHGMGGGLAGLDLKTNNIPTEEEVVEAYCNHMGIKAIDNWDYYIAFNLFRVAAIAFGIMGRVRDGTATSKSAVANAQMAPIISEFALSQIRQ